VGRWAERGLHSKDRLLEWYERAIEDHLLEIEANSNKYVHATADGSKGHNVN
jgi:hypothetical protein